jgi:hypothetical protein
VIWPIILPLLGGAVLFACLAVLGSRPAAPLVCCELRLPEELKPEQLEALLRHTAALRDGPVCVVVRASLGRLRFFLAASEATIESLLAAGAGLIPEARFERLTHGVPVAPARSSVVGASVAWDGPWPLLRPDEPHLTAAGLLGVLASVGEGEAIELRVRVWPARRVDRPAAGSARASVPANPWFMRLWWPAQPPREEMRAIRAKYSGLIVIGEVLVTATAGNRAVAVANTQRVIAALRTAGGIRGVLRYRVSYRPVRVRQVLERRRAPLPWELRTLLSPQELVAIVGLPLGGPMIHGIGYGAGPRLMPPLDLPSAGRVFATSNFPGTLGRLLAQPVRGGLQHVAAIGPTGSGKSALVGSLARADFAAGRGAFVLDLKGDLVEDLLALVPPDREQDVIVLEPARGGAQPGLRLFASGGDPELTGDLVLGTLRELFHDSWGIRSSQYLGLGLKTLAGVPESTLVDLPVLFTEPAFRAKALGRVRDPWLRAAWKRYLALSEAERATHVVSPLTKLEELVGRGRLRLVLGQSDSKLDFQDVLANRRIVLVSLPPGLLGMPATQLLAALTLWQFFQAVERRAALPRQARTPFFAYVDEVAVLGQLPLPLDGILERARGHGVGLTLSPQSLSQLSPDLRSVLLANVGSLITFQQPSEDEAKLLARAMPGVTASQLQHLDRFEVAMRLSLGPGHITQTMTGETLPPASTVSDPMTIRQIAAQRWGQTLVEIDDALTRRYGLEAVDEAHQARGSVQLGVTRRRR